MLVEDSATTSSAAKHRTCKGIPHKRHLMSSIASHDVVHDKQKGFPERSSTEHNLTSDPDGLAALGLLDRSSIATSRILALFTAESKFIMTESTSVSPVLPAHTGSSTRLCSAGLMLSLKRGWPGLKPSAAGLGSAQCRSCAPGYPTADGPGPSFMAWSEGVLDEPWAPPTSGGLPCASAPPLPAHTSPSGS